MSLSLTVTATPLMPTLLYSAALLDTTAWLMESESLAVSSSSPALTITRCAVSQFERVNVRLVGLVVTSPPAVVVIVTFPDGSVSSTTV